MMATYTTHYNLKKPATSDKIRIADFNGNADIIDGQMYDNASLGAQLKADIGIVENTDTATHNISAGQYVIWKGSLYTASSAISSGATLSSANLTAVSGGGLNALNGKIATTIISSQTSIVALAGTVESGETRKFYVDNASSTLTDYPASMTSYGAVRYCQITIERISSVKAVRITAVTQGGASASIAGEVIGSSVYWEASPAVINSNFTVSSLSQLVDGTVPISGDTNWHTASGTFNVNYKKYFIRIGPNGTVYNSVILDKQELDRLSSGNTFRISTYWDANNVGMISVHGNEYSITAKCKDYAFTYYIGGMN